MLMLKNVYKKKSSLKAKQIEPLLNGLVWLKELRVSNKNAILALNVKCLAKMHHLKMLLLA